MRQETQRLVGILWLEAMHRVILPLPPPMHPFFFFFFLLTPVSLSIHCASTCPRAKLREAVHSGWMRGWWVDKQETLVTHYDRGESYYMIRVAFFLRVADMAITQLNPLSDDEGPLVTFTSTCVEKKSQGETAKTGSLQECKHT